MSSLSPLVLLHLLILFISHYAASYPFLWWLQKWGTERKIACMCTYHSHCFPSLFLWWHHRLLLLSIYSRRQQRGVESDIWTARIPNSKSATRDDCEGENGTQDFTKKERPISDSTSFSCFVFVLLPLLSRLKPHKVSFLFPSSIFTFIPFPSLIVSLSPRLRKSHTDTQTHGEALSSLCDFSLTQLVPPLSSLFCLFFAAKDLSVPSSIREKRDHFVQQPLKWWWRWCLLFAFCFSLPATSVWCKLYNFLSFYPPPSVLASVPFQSHSTLLWSIEVFEMDKRLLRLLTLLLIYMFLYLNLSLSLSLFTEERRSEQWT